MAHKIFTFWEPKGRLTPYLGLCMETWEVNLVGYDVVVLDYSNLHEYLPGDVFDLRLLRRMSPQLVKDAVMVGLLAEHGGVFMDADTIAIRDIEPILRRLRSREVVMFNTHVAFIAARPHSRLLSLWYRGVEAKLAALKNRPGSSLELSWDYLGNSELAEAKQEMIAQSRLLGLPQRVAASCDRFTKDRASGARGWTLWSRVLAAASRRVRARSEWLGFATVLGKHLTMLDRDRYGFIAEVGYSGDSSFDPRQRYLDFWFEADVDVEEAFRNEQMLIGLHHSWTPEWYRALDRDAVLAHECLLSRTLRRVLSASPGGDQDLCRQ